MDAKTLILNGSPRRDGDTAVLIGRLTEQLKGEVRVVNAYDGSIGPCTDCRYCWEHAGCAIKDGMQAVYRDIETCDNLVIASPIFFSELTGPLLGVASRLQTYYAARRFRKAPIPIKPKRGAVMLCGGGDGSPDKAMDTARCLLKHMKAALVGGVYSLHTDRTPSRDDIEALKSVDQLARMLNEF